MTNIEELEKHIRNLVRHDEGCFYEMRECNCPAAKNATKILTKFKSYMAEVIGKFELLDNQAIDEVMLLNGGNVSRDEVVQFEKERRVLRNELRQEQRIRAGITDTQGKEDKEK